MIEGKWIGNFLSTLRKLGLVNQPSQVMFRPSFMPTIDDMVLKLSWIHLNMKDKNGKTENTN